MNKNSHTKGQHAYYGLYVSVPLKLKTGLAHLCPHIPHVQREQRVERRNACVFSELFARESQLPLLLGEMPLEAAAQNHSWYVFAASW